MTENVERPSSELGSVAERLRRLQRLGVQRGRSGLAAPGPSATASQPPAPSLWPTDSSDAALPIEEVVGGQVVETPFGACVVAETRYALGEARGGWTLAQTLRASGAALAACGRDARLSRATLRQAAFLDTETTGLAGGAGTFAFMVGMGVFEGSDDTAQHYVVRQVFMRSPAEERALLHVTTETLAGCTGLVTFNGRAFDGPLLATRFAMHHLPSPLDTLWHLDLLPLARQRWRLRLPSCAMSAIEHDILAFQRSVEDVPGWLIPSLYQDYARTGESSAMGRVFYHNREDVVSMAPLAAMLAAPFEGSGAAAALQDLHPIDTVSLGRCFEELGWTAASEAAYRRALDRSLPAEVRAMALARLGWLLKRQERRQEACAVWQDWITSVPGADPTPYAELAKHHEWHEVDLAAARRWTLWGLHTAQQMPPGPAREDALAELQHRLERLERKLAEG